MRISDWSSDVCSSDLLRRFQPDRADDPGQRGDAGRQPASGAGLPGAVRARPRRAGPAARAGLAGAGRAHGADQLPAAVAGRRARVPRVWPGAVGATGTRGAGGTGTRRVRGAAAAQRAVAVALPLRPDGVAVALAYRRRAATSELQSLMSISYAVF